MSRVTGLAHIGVFVKDVDASIAFYKKLGFNVDGIEDVGIRLAFISAGSCAIELVEQKDKPARQAGSVDHIAMQVDDIEAAVADAQAAGIAIDPSKIAKMDICGGIRNIFFEGPDGERLEFVQSL